MTKKLVFLLLVCLVLVGCGKTAAYSAGNTVPSSGETQIGNTVPASGETQTGNTESQSEGTTAVPDATDATSSTEESDTEETAPEKEKLPEPVSFWNPICNNCISLFESTQSTEAFATIPKGATIGLVNWDGRYARVVYDGQEGYVYSHCLKPVDPDYFSKYLKVLTLTTKYTYGQMQADMKTLQALYPQLITISSIGKTEMRRDIPVMVVGDPNAKYQILVQAAMHGREHFTAWIAMAMMDYLLKENNIPADVCYHIIPMSNPDGVIISQTGKLEEEQMVVYELDLEYGYVHSSLSHYATQWKANALGEDINRNFIAGWIPSDERSNPSSEKYRGTEPFSTAEAWALRNYTMRHTFHATLSLHSYGNVLYYQYGTKQPVNRLSYSLAKAVKGVTGYIPTAHDNTTGAGYKDWVMEELGIPSLTVEIGSYSVPIPQQDTYNSFDRCRDLLPTVYNWLKKK